MNEFPNLNKSRTSEYILNDIAFGKVDVTEKKRENVVIKWWQVKMSLEEKARFGLLTYPEYLEWIEECNKKAMGEAESSDTSTFWGNDTEARTNVSNSEYEEFLANNSVDISNSSTIDFAALAAQVEGESGAHSQNTNDVSEALTSSSEPSVDEILANVNRDMHGGDAILSQEEIEALFAAAAG